MVNRLHTVPIPKPGAHRDAHGKRRPGPALTISLLLHALVLGVLFALPRPDIAHWSPSSAEPFTLHFPNEEVSLAEIPDPPESAAPPKPPRKLIRKPHQGLVAVPIRAALPLPPISLPELAEKTASLLSPSFDPSMDFPRTKPEMAEPGNQSKPPARPKSSPAKATVAARPLKTRAPIYPDLALKRHYQGTSVFIATIKANGIVENLQLSKTSGHPILDQAAENALRHWKFAPATRNGVAVDSQLRIPIVFRLG